MNEPDLLPRPEIRRALLDALADSSVLLYGPRRVGKSTLLEMLAGEPSKQHQVLDGFYLREGPGETLQWVNPLFRRWWCRYGSP